MSPLLEAGPQLGEPAPIITSKLGRQSEDVSRWPCQALAVQDADALGLPTNEAAALKVVPFHLDASADGFPAAKGRIDLVAVGRSAPPPAMQVAAIPLTEDAVAAWLATPSRGARVVARNRPYPAPPDPHEHAEHKGQHLEDNHEADWPERPEWGSLQEEGETFQGDHGDTEDVAQGAE
jgi:hypothetical protein